jgi:hypothetical protein
MNKIDMNAKEIKFIKMNTAPAIQSLN